ncbi:tetratricopeptide repeat-containing sensor histidine kinase [Pedobacter steynii]|uniref:Histidine kinase n=1 Tax=Pedobacter steynii TaxID=430522 RepID=A0A1D7QI94_9SPHI|nr:histidine kinase [Pedobacter steynii]AOM78396.1 histidine kinase [Pedobacter steynii]
MTTRNTHLLFLVLPLLLIFSCVQKKNDQNDLKKNSDKNSRKDYMSMIIAMDTLLPKDSRKMIYREDSLLRNLPDTGSNPFYHYFKGRRFSLEKKKDSAMAAYEKMIPAHDGDEVDLLKNYTLLDRSSSNGRMVEAALMNRILAFMQKAEQSKSRLTHYFYDLLAKVYYQNQNEKVSLDYVERYYKSHPYKSHPVIKQRYYDVSFLLASRMGDYDKMMRSNVSARNFARSIGDSMAIARTYDYEAQVYDRKGDHRKSIASSRIYFNYLKRTNSLHDIAFNNLATSFEHNNQTDSAIYYYKEGIAFAKKNPQGKQKSFCYNGLMNAYKRKGDYAAALAAADSAYNIEISNLKEIEAVKVAEIREKYEVEKKDRNITDLSNRNQLNEKVIVQQRWTLGLASLVFLGVLSFFYVIQRQRRLKEKNELLQSENKRLNIEQKLLQVQLNPHFIFNSIANLQSLVATGNANEAVRYLTVFSGLLRNILEQSRKDFIGLDEEIASLDNYLQLQQMRFLDLFDYHINIDENLHPQDLLIPPMLLQPFVENAIEHGFRNIDYKGLLTIRFKVENNQMIITVDDNGEGLTEKNINPQKKQSLAGIILKERLDVLFNSQGREAKYEIEDKKINGEQGVTVHIVIPEIRD